MEILYNVEYALIVWLGKQKIAAQIYEQIQEKSTIKIKAIEIIKWR